MPQKDTRGARVSEELNVPCVCRCFAAARTSMVVNDLKAVQK